jgi:hypothetical protein
LFTVNLGNYWNLFMQILLELQFYPQGRPEPEWIAAYARQYGGVTLGLARFRDSVDWHYGVGYIKHLLWSGRREEFLLSLYSAIVHGASEVRTSPEDCSVWPARTSNEGHRLELEAARWNWQSGYDEALSASPGVTLQLVRTALVDEGQGDAGDDGRLVLLSGIPNRWLADGKEIHLARVPTHYGPIWLDVASRVAGGRIEARLRIEPRGELRSIELHLFHPQGRPIRSATLNGKPLAPRNGQALVFAPGAEKNWQIVAEF